MTPYVDVTTTDKSREATQSLLWLPYLLITLVCLLLLAINFWCYHRRRRLQYERKTEVMETRKRVMERRVILNIVKAKYKSYLVDETNAGENDPVVFTNSMQCSSNGHEIANL